MKRSYASGVDAELATDASPSRMRQGLTKWQTSQTSPHWSLPAAVIAVPKHSG
jgi:hypothetical protein